MSSNARYFASLTSVQQTVRETVRGFSRPCVRRRVGAHTSLIMISCHTLQTHVERVLIVDKLARKQNDDISSMSLPGATKNNLTCLRPTRRRSPHVRRGSFSGRRSRLSVRRRRCLACAATARKIWLQHAMPRDIQWLYSKLMRHGYHQLLLKAPH